MSMKITEPFMQFLVRLTIVIPDHSDFRGAVYLLMGRHFNEL